MQPYSEQERFKDFIPQPARDEQLEYFFSHAYHDMRFFMKSVTKSNASTFTYFGDIQRNLFYISDNMRDTFGFDSNVVEGLLDLWRDRIWGSRWKEIYDEDRRSLFEEKRDTHDLRYQVRDKDGNVFWIRFYGAMQWDSKKEKPLFFAGRITRQDELFAVDPVTNFPMESTLKLRLDKVNRKTQKLLAIGFSLNNITQINTMHGRSAGDRLIADISKELMNALISKMSFYRLSGIRCLALVNESVTEPKEALIDQIRTIICEGYNRAGIVLDRPCSFAVMGYPKGNLGADDFMENMTSLIKLACDEPKQPFIEDSQDNIEKIREISNIQMELTRNVLNGMENFRAVIQPVVSAQSGQIIAGETLMRWQYQGRDVSPGIFIPILEQDRMIHVAGRWIMEQAVKACADICQWLPDFYLTVNVSLQQLYDEELPIYIPQVLNQYHLDGKHLVIEMTESSMDKEPGKLKSLIDVCQGLGVRLALDDFGTGYSSLRVLMQYNTNVIKLDRSLLLEMTQSEDKNNFISSIVFACHQFGKKVVMEGVETDVQRQLVVGAQCDMIQGFYYYRPMEIPKVYSIIKAQSQEEAAVSL